MGWLEFGFSWLTPVSKAKTGGEWKDLTSHAPHAPCFTIGGLIPLVSHREEQKMILLQWRTWDEPSACSTAWLLWDIVRNSQWGADGVFSVISEYASSKGVIQEKDLNWVFSFVCLSIVLFLRGKLTGRHS